MKLANDATFEDKQKTDSENVTEITSKNNRKMLKGICIICGSKKSQFIKNIPETLFLEKVSKNFISGKGISDVIGRIGVLHLPASKGEEVANRSLII